MYVCVCVCVCVRACVLICVRSCVCIESVSQDELADRAQNEEGEGRWEGGGMRDVPPCEYSKGRVQQRPTSSLPPSLPLPGRDVRISCAHLIHRSTYAGSRRWRALLGCGPRHRAPSCAASAASPPRLLRPPTLHARILRRGAAEAANRGATTQRTGAGRRTGARPARAAPLREASLCGVAGRPRVCPAAGPVDPGPGYQAGIRPGSAHNSRGPTLRSNQTSRAEHFCKRNPGHLFLSSGRK